MKQTFLSLHFTLQFWPGGDNGNLPDDRFIDVHILLGGIDEAILYGRALGLSLFGTCPLRHCPFITGYLLIGDSLIKIHQRVNPGRAAIETI